MSAPGVPHARTTLILCASAALFEGFDNQSMGVAAPMLFREFTVLPSQAGVIFSAATLGLFLGAAIGGRAADYVGRKQALVASLLLFGLFSLLTSLVHSTQLIIVTRLLTGLGCGGAMPNFIALASEAVAPRRRLSAVTLVMAALPFGGALAGVMALGDRLGWSWRSIFIAGGIAPLALALIILSTVRSSQPGSGTKPKEAARLAPVDRVGTVLWKMNRAPTTLLLWTGFFFTQLVLFLMLNWLPTLIVGLGFSRAEASLASIGFNVAGGFGAAFLGRAHTGAHRWRWVLITYGGITAAMAALVAAATFGKAFVLLILACALAGSFIVGAQLILFALAPLYYPSANRGTGVGAAVAFGRLGSVAGPVFAATLLAAGRNSTTVLAGMVPFVVIAGCAALALTRRPESMD